VATTDRGGVRLGKVSTSTGTEVLAAQLREKIISGSVATGDMIATERALSEQTGLSRTSVREALRILVGEGLIDIRTGRGGGSIVRRVSPEMVGRAVDAYIRVNQLDIREVLQVRDCLDPACAELAATARDESDLESLRLLHHEMEELNLAGDVTGFHDVNLRWHLAVAAASHNRIIIAFLESIASSIRSAIADDWSTRERRETTIGAHKHILDAIERQDAQEARRYMTLHVHAYVGIAISEIAERSAAPPEDSTTPAP
jgi:GntR family transcriptional repressor for pyruvate dehydrogenase complex